ncbi:hypothetical protein VTL71DRAFT_16298 [Oculimacula yallundae]|uniref:Uncharacterized protein n=1 Tax=Oculimacula yallundae TaxID=86028 RepID=A0ABR4CEM1_9HELO
MPIQSIWKAIVTEHVADSKGKETTSPYSQKQQHLDQQLLVFALSLYSSPEIYLLCRTDNAIIGHCYHNCLKNIEFLRILHRRRICLALILPLVYFLTNHSPKPYANGTLPPNVYPQLSSKV